METKDLFACEIGKLNENQRQLLKDTLRFGEWGDGSMEFLDENGNVETAMSIGFCTNDAKMAGNFSGRQVSAMFRGMYGKLCPSRTGRLFTHCSNWWGDGRGDMLFIRSEYFDQAMSWANEPKK